MYHNHHDLYRLSNSSFLPLALCSIGGDGVCLIWSVLFCRLRIWQASCTLRHDEKKKKKEKKPLSKLAGYTYETESDLVSRAFPPPRFHPDVFLKVYLLPKNFHQSPESPSKRPTPEGCFAWMFYWLICERAWIHLPDKSPLSVQKEN